MPSLRCECAGQAPLDRDRREKLVRDLMELDVLAARLRAVVPDSFDLEEQKRQVAKAAERAEVKVFEVREVARETVTPLTVHRLEVSGDASATVEVPGAGVQGMERGQSFRDGTLSAIASDSVTFTTAGRNVVVPFP